MQNLIPNIQDMTFSWQDIAAVIFIAAAAIYIIMRLLRLGPWRRSLSATPAKRA